MLIGFVLKKAIKKPLLKVANLSIWCGGVSQTFNVYAPYNQLHHADNHTDNHITIYQLFFDTS
jgi:hypothetical protein